MKSVGLDDLNRELSAASPDLVANEELLRGVLAGSGDCIKILDLQGRLQFMSEGGKRVMEVENFEPLKGCPWPDFWPGEGNAQAAAAVQAAKAGKTSSFRGAANTAKGNPRYWDVQVSPIFGDDGRAAHILSISRDITEQWNLEQQREETRKRERFLTQELEHRVKNTYALVVSIAKQTFRAEASAEQLEAFNARIMLLSRVHDLVKAANWTNAPVLAVIEAALASHRTGEGQFSFSGPELRIAPNQAVALTLAVNELATNAAKYGALSVRGGKVAVVWSTSANGAPTFNFTWREHGGPAVTRPTRQGFGSKVITDLLANDFGGKVRLLYEPGGVICELQSPLEKLPK